MKIARLKEADQEKHGKEDAQHSADPGAGAGAAARHDRNGACGAVVSQWPYRPGGQGWNVLLFRMRYCL